MPATTPFRTSPPRSSLPVPPDETVRWSGAPPTGHLWRRTDWLTVPFSLMWCGFALFWEGGVIASGAPFFFKLWGLPFVAVGLYMVAGRFVWDAHVRAGTRYAVTDRAAYVFRGGSERRFAGAELDDVRVERNADGSGTLRFGAEAPQGRRGVPASSPDNAFEAIPDVDAAYDAVRAARR